MQHIRRREYRLARQGSLKAVEVTEKAQLLVLILRSEDNKEQLLVRVTRKGVARYPQESLTWLQQGSVGHVQWGVVSIHVPYLMD